MNFRTKNMQKFSRGYFSLPKTQCAHLRCVRRSSASSCSFVNMTNRTKKAATIWWASAPFCSQQRHTTVSLVEAYKDGLSHKPFPAHQCLTPACLWRKASNTTHSRVTEPKKRNWTQSSWGWGQVYKYLCSRHQWCVTLHLAKNPSACTPWDAGGCLSMQWTHIITPRPTNLTAGGAASLTSFLSGWSFLASFSSPSEDRAHILDYYLNPYLIWHTSAYFASFPWIK